MEIFRVAAVFLLLGLDLFGFLWLVCCNKRKEENTMTIEKANKDFNQLIEQNGFINTGAKTPTGCEVYSREGIRKVQVAWYGESNNTLAIKIWISYGAPIVWVIRNGRIEDRIRDFSSPKRAMNAIVGIVRCAGFEM